MCSGRYLIAALMLCTSAFGGQQTSDALVSPSKPKPSNFETVQRNLMLGKWYGNQLTNDGGLTEWIVERDIRGTYSIRFRTTRNNGTIKESTEIGEWGISGAVYFSTMKGWVIDGRIKPSDATNPYNYDAYKITSLTSETFAYESFASGNKFIVKKVSDNFSFSKP